MPIYDYSIAKSALNQADKDRILYLYLSSNSAEIDWERATAAFGGSCTVRSFKQMTYQMHKRIEKAGGKVETSKNATKKLNECKNESPKRPLHESRKAENQNQAKTLIKKPRIKHECTSDAFDPESERSCC